MDAPEEGDAEPNAAAAAVAATLETELDDEALEADLLERQERGELTDTEDFLLRRERAQCEAFLAETWESDSRFLNFMESERFRAAALALAAAGPLDADALRVLLAEHVRVSILRDAAAREEFVTNLELTRL